MEPKTYRIIFKDNTGSFAIDGIASTVQGDWSDTVQNYDGQGHDIGFITVNSDDAAEYLEELLNDDDNVIEYRIR